MNNHVGLPWQVVKQNFSGKIEVTLPPKFNKHIDVENDKSLYVIKHKLIEQGNLELLTLAPKMSKVE